MPRKKDWGTGALRTLFVFQEKIRTDFGEEAIAEAKVKLCKRCKRLKCGLLPITTKGEVCPYFELREGMK